MADDRWPLHIDSRVGAHETVVVASGEVNRTTSDSLREELRRHVGRVAIDLRAVDHMNATGISLLLKEKRRLERSGGSLRIIGGNKLRSLFEMTGLRGVLDVQDSDSGSVAE